MKSTKKSIHQPIPTVLIQVPPPFPFHRFFHHFSNPRHPWPPPERIWHPKNIYWSNTKPQEEKSPGMSIGKNRKSTNKNLPGDGWRSCGMIDSSPKVHLRHHVASWYQLVCSMGSVDSQPSWDVFEHQPVLWVSPNQNLLQFFPIWMWLEYFTN